MKVKVSIINTGCIILSQAVAVPSLMMMTLILSEESLARELHTARLTDTGEMVSLTSQWPFGL